MLRMLANSLSIDANRFRPYGVYQIDDVYAGVDYGLFEHMAIGTDINSMSMDLGVTKIQFTGDFDWQYAGALLFLKIDW